MARGMTKDEIAALMDDPSIQAAMAQAQLATEAVERAAAAVMRKRGMQGYTPKCDPAKLAFRKDDPNPWHGKQKVPAMLVRMGCEGKGLGLKTNGQRHAALIAEACKRCGATRDSETRTKSVWTNKLEGFSLTNCRRIMRAAGYTVPNAVNTVAAFFKVIEAGKDSGNDPAQQLGVTYGSGLHAITFLSANDLLYQGARLNLQWASKGKKCDPINGSATVSGKLDSKPVRGGLRALLLRLKSITSEDWHVVKQAAQKAEENSRAREALRDMRKAQEAQRAQLDESGLFESIQPERTGGAGEDD